MNHVDIGYSLQKKKIKSQETTLIWKFTNNSLFYTQMINMYRMSSKYSSNNCPLKLDIIKHLKNNIKNFLAKKKITEILNHGTGYITHVQS